METFEKVKTIVVDSLNCDPDAVTMTADLKEDLGADSLDAMELVMALEDEFSISIPTEKAKELKTIGEVVALIDASK